MRRNTRDNIVQMVKY